MGGAELIDEAVDIIRRETEGCDCPQGFQLTDQMWSSRNFLSNVKAEDGKYLTASCGYRGAIATNEVDDEIVKIQAKMADDFVSWIPNNIKSAIINVPPEGVDMSATFVANTTSSRACSSVSLRSSRRCT